MCAARTARLAHHCHFPAHLWPPSQIWSLMRHYNEKLHDSRDACNRLSPFTPVGAGFWDALARQEARLAARAGGGGGEL